MMNNFEMGTWPYVKQLTSTSLMHEAGHPIPVLMDNPEGQGGEGGGKGVQDRGTLMYTCG